MKQVIYFISIFLIAACSSEHKSEGNKKNSDSLDLVTQSINNVDTLVGSKPITEEIAGSAFRKRATAYFIITGIDTSDFVCVLMEAKENGTVQMELTPRRAKDDSKTYKQRLFELKKILPFAAKDYKFDSINNVFLGSLISHGDLAIDVTKHYIKKYGSSTKITDYKKIESFLLTSKLAIDINELFKPYNLSVKKVGVEKAFFMDKKDLYLLSKIEYDTTAVPDKILTCITWLNFK